MTRPSGSMLLARGVRQLSEAGIPDAPRDARRLLAFASGVEAGRLTLVLPEPVSIEVEAEFAALLQRRCAREPVSHLIGSRMFYGRTFEVNRFVLDPRPETEILVEAALRRSFARVLDLGTGSGCILLTLLAEVPEAVGIGADLSPEALLVAARNARTLGLEDRVQFVASNWTQAIDGSFDLIVSNPPYIAASEMPDLAPEVRDFEPEMALTDGADGLDAYRAIAKGLHPLRTGGDVLLEIGPTQGMAVRAIFAAQGFERIEIIKDLDGRDRVVACFGKIGA